MAHGIVLRHEDHVGVGREVVCHLRVTMGWLVVGVFGIKGCLERAGGRVVYHGWRGQCVE